MAELERLWIWQEEDLKGELLWYRQVSSNTMPAKFRIAETVPVEVSLQNAAEEQLTEGTTHE